MRSSAIVAIAFAASIFVGAGPSQAATCYSGKMVDFDVLSSTVNVQADGSRNNEHFVVSSAPERAAINSYWRPVDSIEICDTDVSRIFQLADDAAAARAPYDVRVAHGRRAQAHL